MCSLMRARLEIAECLELREQGLNATQISRRLRVPRSTVRDWVCGRAPRASMHARGTCEACGGESHAHAELAESYLYLLGVYLGDGCISAHHRGVFRLRVFLDARYPGVVDEVVAAMMAVMPRNRVSRVFHPSPYAEAAGNDKSCVEVSTYSKSWPCLLPQHGPGKKHERRIALAGWQWELVERYPELLLRGLIHSDGCRFMNTGRGGWRNPRYSFCNLSPGIRWIFFDVCDLLELHATWSPPKTIYVSRKADVARMDEFIGPKG
jgi:hypothetical protein